MADSRYIFGGMELLTMGVGGVQKDNCWTLVYIKEGIGMYLLDSSLRCLDKGDMLFLPPRVQYSFMADDLGSEYNDEIDAFVLMFDERWLDELLNVFPSMASVALKIKEIRNPLAIVGPKWLKMLSFLENYISDVAEDKPLSILGLLGCLSTEKDSVLIKEVCIEEDFSVRERIEKINRYLSCNMFGKVTLDDVATYIGMNRTYFCLFFKKHFGDGFSDYMNRKRVQKACEMLSCGDMEIATVASECGFKTVPYFMRVFVKVMGTTPRKYMKSRV